MREGFQHRHFLHHPPCTRATTLAHLLCVAAFLRYTSRGGRFVSILRRHCRAAGEHDLSSMCESWLAYRRDCAAAMYAYGMWLDVRRK